jgi:poly-gamma-glutamate synthesis protein (capsule biosynthesis protein)
VALVLACNGPADTKAPVTVAAPAPEPAPPVVVVPAPAPVVAVAEPPAAPEPVAPAPDEKAPKFTRACEAGDRVTIAAVGDLLLHHELQIQAYAAPDNFLVLWSGVKDLISQADVSYANFEGTAAAGLNRKGVAVADPGRRFDKVVYSSYPRFNYHPSLVDDLVRTGFDVVSTANNHAMDREPPGVDATIAALAKGGLVHTGTRATTAAADAPWHAITESKGVRVAWLACTHHTNQIPDPHGQVLTCYDGKAEAEVAKLAADPNIDAVIVTPHWGKEYKPLPDAAQRSLAGRLAEAGATAVIGGHPHVLQPWEVRKTKDEREVFVMYSLGNFASHQIELPQRSSMILYLGLTKPPGKKAFVHGARYVPLHVRQKGDEFFVEAIDRVAGPANSRALTVKVFGESAVLAPGAPLATRQACEAQSIVTPASPGGGSG